MEINRNNINELVNKCHVSPDKDYGQNFLIEPSISEKIVSLLDVNETDNVLEIGPGLGSLTHFLYGNCVLSVCDIDSRMIDFLKIFYKNDIEFILDDVRKIDVSNYDKIIANLPYNITTELISFLLMNSNAKKMVLMCQSETYLHFSETLGKEYGPISILIHLLGEVKKEIIVKKGSFYPAPKCSSLVFTYVSNNNVNKEFAIETYKLTKSLFLNRRKTIYNNLKNHLKDEIKAKEVLSFLNVDVNKRPEEISPIQYLEMYKYINKI